MVAVDLPALLRRSHCCDPTTVSELIASAAADLPGTDVVLYLVDFGRTVLEPLPDRSVHGDVPAAEAVLGTMAGRAFAGNAPVTVERSEGFRVWVPIVEGSDRTGVMAVTVPHVDERLLRSCEELGLIAGCLIAVCAHSTDVYNLYRRRRSMNLAASMQWDILPPLILRTDRVSVAGLIEPAYEVGGDCFDYAANGPVLDFALMDVMGHGLESAEVAALAMGAYRHGRREGQLLPAVHVSLGETIRQLHDGQIFVAGILGRVELATGTVTWTNAGHPLPLLVRGRRVVGEITCPPTPPWGALRTSPQPQVATELLEPGDSLLLYTDGVTEARTPQGDEFGIERLVDIVERTAADGLPTHEVVRHLARSVAEHQAAPLRDDATVVLVTWNGPDTTESQSTQAKSEFRQV